MNESTYIPLYCSTSTLCVITKSREGLSIPHMCLARIRRHCPCLICLARHLKHMRTGHASVSALGRLNRDVERYLSG
jgi:hypothetical protein